MCAYVYAHRDGEGGWEMKGGTRMNFGELIFKIKSKRRN